jgi:hypothetical protein
MVATMDEPVVAGWVVLKAGMKELDLAGTMDKW